jgi:hypothetical protein
MSQYLVAIHLPDDFDPSVVTEAMVRDIDVLNEEMGAAGVRLFAGGLSTASDARSLRAQPDGKVLVTDGPYLETKEHVGGFWLLECANLDEALAWGRCRRLSGAGRGARVSPHSAGWTGPLILRASRISALQIPLARLKKWSSCRFSVSPTTI